MPIYEKRLQNDVARIRDEVTTLGEQVEEALKNATLALFSDNDELANLTILRDQGINRLNRRINHLSHGFIARHQPSATHLRLTSSVLRMVSELERIGDYAVTISRASLHMKQRPEGVVQRDIELMADHSRSMLNQAMEAFASDNSEMARGTMAMANQVEKEFGAALEDLVDLGKKDDADLSAILDFQSILYMLERVSDRAKNICEETLYVVAGEIKAEEVFSILFIDDDNSVMSQMAEAIAKKSYPASAKFSSAGREAASEIDPMMVDYMSRNGLNMKGMTPKGVDTFAPDMASIDVIISLQGSVRDYPVDIPFHTAFLTWDVGAKPGGDDKAKKEQYSALHRDISTFINDLMLMLRGEGEG